MTHFCIELHNSIIQISPSHFDQQQLNISPLYEEGSTESCVEMWGVKVKRRHKQKSWKNAVLSDRLPSPHHGTMTRDYFFLNMVGSEK